jgi:eukaryotic-like serine/threonine-protein kinase
MELAPGLEISGSLRLVRKLGEGGMGSVWVADHQTLRTQVAVKFMTEHLAQNADAAARFAREATAAAQIKSPHVVQIFDHGLLDGRVPFIVMELLEGEELSGFMKRQGPLSAEVTGQVIGQMCKALAKAHARSVIHRDIKPDNVFLVDSDGEIFVKILDFGIAKQIQENVHVTSTGAVMGTPHYMSPEQLLSSKHVDARSDLWAVGVVAYQCLTGRVPFDGETFAGIALAIASGQYPPPFATWGAGSPELDAWFARALSRDLGVRFASAREMVDAFAAVSSGASRLSHVDLGAGASFVVPARTAAPVTATGSDQTALLDSSLGLRPSLPGAGSVSVVTTNGIAVTNTGLATAAAAPAAAKKNLVIGLGAAAAAVLIGLVVLIALLARPRGDTPEAALPAPDERAAAAEPPATELAPATDEPSPPASAEPPAEATPPPDQAPTAKPAAAVPVERKPAATKPRVKDRGF